MINIVNMCFMWVLLPSFGATLYIPQMMVERPLFVRERSDGLVSAAARTCPRGAAGPSGPGMRWHQHASATPPPPDAPRRRRPLRRRPQYTVFAFLMNKILEETAINIPVSLLLNVMVSAPPAGLGRQRRGGSAQAARPTLPCRPRRSTSAWASRGTLRGCG